MTADLPKHSVSVAAAIFDDSGENVLLVKRRDNGRWEPPGGVLELDETIEAGLRREVREETGAEINVGPLTGVYKNMTRAIVNLVCRCELISAPRSNSVEATAIRWWALEHVAALLDEAYAIRVHDACVPNALSPAVRAHDGTMLKDGSP